MLIINILRSKILDSGSVDFRFAGLGVSLSRKGQELFRAARPRPSFYPMPVKKQGAGGMKKLRFLPAIRTQRAERLSAL